MNEPETNSERPVAHQRLIALMQTAKAPLPDADTPEIPDELLRRLREQYGRAPTRNSTLWDRVRQQVRSPHLALAASILILGVLTVLMLPQNHGTDDVMRGGSSKILSAPSYWLNTNNDAPAPTGLGLPKFITIHTLADLPKTGTALVFDPAHHEAHLIRDGIPEAPATITDPTDNDEWLTVHRQLLQQLNAQR